MRKPALCHVLLLLLASLVAISDSARDTSSSDGEMENPEGHHGDHFDKAQDIVAGTLQSAAKDLSSASSHAQELTESFSKNLEKYRGDVQNMANVMSLIDKNAETLEVKYLGAMVNAEEDRLKPLREAGEIGEHQSEEAEDYQSEEAEDQSDDSIAEEDVQQAETDADATNFLKTAASGSETDSDNSVADAEKLAEEAEAHAQEARAEVDKLKQQHGGKALAEAMPALPADADPGDGIQTAFHLTAIPPDLSNPSSMTESQDYAKGWEAAVVEPANTEQEAPVDNTAVENVMADTSASIDQLIASD